MSVIVPTHNRPEFLPDALQSLLAQSLRSWECIVIDDGSTIPPEVPSDPRFRAVRHSVAKGPAGARNTGIRLARGTFIAFLDDDDVLDPGALTALVNAAAPGQMTFGRARLLGDPVGSTTRLAASSTDGPLIDNPPLHTSGLYPRESCLEYDEELQTGEDVEWLFRMSLAHTVVHISENCYQQRRHSGVRPRVQQRTSLEGRLRLLSKHEQWFLEHPSSHAKQLARCAAAAHLANDHAFAARLAMRSLRLHPNRLALSLFVRSLVKLSARAT